MNVKKYLNADKTHTLTNKAKNVKLFPSVIKTNSGVLKINAKLSQNAQIITTSVLTSKNVWLSQLAQRINS